MTGGGKSVALETLLLGLVEHYSAERLEIRIVDPKGNEFTQFEGLAQVPELPGMDAEDAIELLERTCEEMDSRYRAMKQLSRERKIRVRDIAGYNEAVDAPQRFKWIVVVLDEFADLTSDKENKRTIEGLLQRIAQKARACGIHAVVATQKPSAEVISTTTRSNLGAQLALRVRSGTDSRVIMETSGAESLAGNGDAFLRLSGEEPIRIQCARVS
jgi:DNA phosphorothioation-dependent restriction protein DptH